MEPQYNESPRDWQNVSMNEVWLYRGRFPYILLISEVKKIVVIPRTSLYRGSFYRGSTVLQKVHMAEMRPALTLRS